MRTRLERLTKKHVKEYLAAVRRSRRLHRNLVALPASEEGYFKWLKWSRRESQQHFFITLPESGELAGMVMLSEIVRGYVQSAYLAYCAFVPHAGQGLTRDGVQQGIRYAFEELRLHRLEACIQPWNARSIELVRGLGFRFEGYSPRSIKVSGRWRDHERWALLREEWRPQPASP
jgi:[ribosomal protein S5]-alanine N-acetyltransferase